MKDYLIKHIIPYFMEKVLGDMSLEEMRTKAGELMAQARTWIRDSKTPWDDAVCIPIMEKFCKAFNIPLPPEA